MRKSITNILSILALLLCGAYGTYAAQIVPTAGATEALTVADGDMFYDPSDGTQGGPGGDCTVTNTVAGQYPNCGCVTTTTLTGPAGEILTVTFTEFRVFGTFDWLKIYDGAGTGGTLLWDSNVDGDELSDMTAASSEAFTSTGNELTFEFNATAVVHTCGWAANVSSASSGGGGGGGGGSGAGGPCTLTCPGDTVTLGTDAGECFRTLTDADGPAISGDCASVVTAALMTENFDGAAVPAGWTLSTTSTASLAVGTCDDDASLFYFCTDGYPQVNGGGNPNTAFSGSQFVIDDDNIGFGVDGIHCITSPVVDLSSGGVNMTFDFENEASGTAGDAVVEVYNGASWDEVFRFDVDGGGSEDIDLSTYSNADFQARFCYDDNGGFAWGAAFDNIVVNGNMALSGPAQVTNDLTGGTTLAGAVLNAGTTTTVNFQTSDLSGNIVSCQTTYIIEDQEAPVVDCPSDMTIELGSLECDATVYYAVDYSDNCPFPTGAGTTLDLVQGTGGQGQAGVQFDLNNGSANPVQIQSFELLMRAGTWTVQLYHTTGDTYNGVETTGTVGASDANWIYDGEMVVNSTGGMVSVPLGFTMSPGACKGVYLTSTVSVGGGPIEYSINAGGNEFTDGTLTMYAGIGRTAIPGVFAGGVFGASSGTACTAAANYRVLKGGITYSELVPSNDLVQTAGLPSGSAFPTGVTTNTFVVTDAVGNVDSCSFDVTVLENANPTTDLACEDGLNISIDNDCQVLITPAMMLKGDGYACEDCFEISITDAAGGAVVNPVTSTYAGQVLTVMVTDTCNDVTCWGDVLVEDKIPPVIECTDVTIMCTTSTDPVMAELSGSLSQSASALGLVIDDAGQQFGGNVDPVQASVVLGAAPTGAEVENVEVSVDITHTWIGDLNVSLIAPNGEEFALVSQGCNAPNSADMSATFTDAGTGLSCANTAPAITGTIAPEDAFSGLNGMNPAGTWTVSVVDAFGALDFGTLDAITVTVDWVVKAPLYPTVTDSCGTTTLAYEDNEDYNSCDSTYLSKITRTWTATDQSGNEGTCTQMILIKKANVNDLVVPPHHDGVQSPALSCLGDWDQGCIPGFQNNDNFTFNDDHSDSDHHIRPGYDEGDNYPQPCELGDEISGLCNVWATYFDQEAWFGCERKIFREWKIHDMCSGEVRVHNQIIIITDDEAPALTCPAEITISTDDGVDNCVATWLVQDPVYSDHCSDAHYTVTVTPEGTTDVVTPVNNNGVYIFYNLPVGNHTVNWTALDGCGNDSSCTSILVVRDLIAPVPICDANTRVSLGSDGLAYICKETFDDFGYDNCGIELIQVRRVERGDCYVDGVNYASNDRNWKDCEEFCCNDIGKDVLIEVGYWDYSGNFNYCWVTVEVEDLLPPAIVAPPDITVSCDYKFDLNNLDIFGTVASDRDYVLGSGFTTLRTDNDVRYPVTLDDSVYYYCQYGLNYNGPFDPITWGQDGWATDNCCIELSYTDQIDMECGRSRTVNGIYLPAITRRWTATPQGDDIHPNVSRTAVQRIYILDCDPFYICDYDSRCAPLSSSCATNVTGHTFDDDVEWPCDIFIQDCPVNVPFPTPYELANNDALAQYSGNAYPWYNDDKCSIVADTFRDEVFEVEDACYKVLRHWSIIDWCQYDENTGAGRWDYTQVIKVTDNQPPVIENGDPGCDSTATDCYSGVNLVPSVMDCTPDELLTYWFKLDIDNDGDYDYEGFSLADLDNVPALPYGDHRILWVIEDRCGNRATKELIFGTVDCKKPSPVCHNGLSSVVMPSTGEIEIWSVDWDASSFDNCDTDLDFRIWYPGMDSAWYTYGNYTRPNPNSSGADVLNGLPGSAFFNCAGMVNGQSTTFQVEIYVVDDFGNWDYCTTYVIIDDNDNVCPNPGDPIVSGTVQNEFGVPVTNSMAHLYDLNMQELTAQAVNGNGEFQFRVHAGSDRNVGTDRNDDHLNGVTAQDLAIIQRHIANIELMNSDYKMVAADANADTKVNVLDVLDLRLLLLGDYDVLPNNTSWVMMDEGYAFPGMSRLALPAGFYNEATTLTFNNITSDITDANFVGVKVGDVDEDAIPNGIVSATDRNEDLPLMFETMDQTFKAGDLVSVPVTSANFEEMTAYQLTFGFDANALTFAGVEAGTLELTDANFGKRFVDRGVLTNVFSSSSTVSANSNDVLFTLNFRATAEGTLSNVLNVGSSVTNALAFGANGTTAIRMQYNTVTGEVVEETFAMYQNTPNPFKDYTVIGYVLPQAADVTFSVYDVNGKVVKTADMAGKEGYNEVTLDASEFNAGVMYYQIETENFSATKKMIVVE